MNDRKLHVIKNAHQLFIEKGFQATSIQDILDYSSIAKGTFYKYFPSKNDLFIALLKTIYKKLEEDRNELLLGQDPSNIEIFIKQVELQVRTNRENKLIPLYEEVLFSEDEELKQFIKERQFQLLHWIFGRFIDIFGEEKKPHLLDCAIMFLGILHHNIKFYTIASSSTSGIQEVVRFSVNRIVKIVAEVFEAGDQLIQPDILKKWLPESTGNDHILQQNLIEHIVKLKKSFSKEQVPSNNHEYLDFLQDELLHSKKPRKALIKSVLTSLDTEMKSEDFQKLKKQIDRYLSEIEQ